MKYILIIAMVIFLIVNISFYNKNKSNDEAIKKVVEDNIELKSENNSLKEKQKYFSDTAREKYYNDLVSQAELFIDLVYVQKTEGYEQRKSESKNVMTSELIDRYFASDSMYQSGIETEIKDDYYYVEKYDKDQKMVDILVELTHKVNYNQLNKHEETQIYVRLTLEFTNDKWIVSEIYDMINQPKKQEEEQTQ